MAETDQTEIEEQLAVWEARGDGKTAQEEPRRPGQGDPVALVARV